MSILWSPLKIWMPKNVTTANFRHPVSKSWLRNWRPYLGLFIPVASSSLTSAPQSRDPLWIFKVPLGEKIGKGNMKRIYTWSKTKLQSKYLFYPTCLIRWVKTYNFILLIPEILIIFFSGYFSGYFISFIIFLLFWEIWYVWDKILLCMLYNTHW